MFMLPNRQKQAFAYAGGRVMLTPQWAISTHVHVNAQTNKTSLILSTCGDTLLKDVYKQ